jgi:sulfopyruvate decarboxylase TPP-binding subunit
MQESVVDGVAWDSWSRELFEIFLRRGIRYFGYVPDAGNRELMAHVQAHRDCRAVLLTTEEEGVAMCAGVDLVGQRAALVLQSSGVGNCGNLLSLARGARSPILMVVTMRGEYGEMNPWQYPAGQTVVAMLDAMGIISFRVGERDELEKATEAAIAGAFFSGQGAALILSQQFLGAKAL